MFVCGIDPGLLGGIVILSADFTVRLWLPMPTIAISAKRRRVDGVAVHRFLIGFPGGRLSGVVLETPIAMPGLRSGGLLESGIGYGAVLTAVRLTDAPLVTVAPKLWKAAMHVGSELDHIARRAAEYWPGHVWYGPQGALLDGVCEAALLAVYGLQNGYFTTGQNRGPRIRREMASVPGTLLKA